MSQKKKVNVIGAGVIGITTALILQRNGYQVQILAEHWPGDSDINYTSPWAGAAWKPNFYLNNAKNVDKFERISFETFWALLQTPDTGLMSATIYDYMDKKPELNRDVWYREFVPKVHLSHINESFDDDVDIVVNCTGINARTFGGVQDEKLCPELTLGVSTHALKIISHNVGRQPTRIGGIRLEIEIRKNDKGKNII
ncbi:15875_t:CDS:2, partial [Racocetra fulgida]